LYARASAWQRGADEVTADDVRRGLTIVEFAVSYQQRVYAQTFRRRALQMLESPETAWQCLCMFLPSAHADQTVGVDSVQTASAAEEVAEVAC
jgi:hypothetical protein